MNVILASIALLTLIGVIVAGGIYMFNDMKHSHSK